MKQKRIESFVVISLGGGGRLGSDSKTLRSPKFYHRQRLLALTFTTRPSSPAAAALATINKSSRLETLSDKFKEKNLFYVKFKLKFRSNLFSLLVARK